MKIEKDENANYLIFRPENESDVFNLGIITTRITMPVTFSRVTGESSKLDYGILEDRNLLNFLIGENKLK